MALDTTPGKDLRTLRMHFKQQQQQQTELKSTAPAGSCGTVSHWSLLGTTSLAD
jgi:hypothetical protein